MPVFCLIPQDVLSLGDALPAPGISRARVRWPEPSIVFDALHAALQRAYPQGQLWEHAHAYGRNGRYPNRNERMQRFGSLATAGPFPCLHSPLPAAWFFPKPLDAVGNPDGTWTAMRPMRDPGGRSNLPGPLRYLVAAPDRSVQLTSPSWWSKIAIESYLKNGTPDAAGLKFDTDLFYAQPSGGRAEKRTAGAAAESAIHGFAGLRLLDNVSMGIVASMPLKDRRQAEGLDELMRVHRPSLIVGGRQRVCAIQPLAGMPLESWLPLSEPVPDTRVKWVLLSPAVFPAIAAPARGAAHPGGWLPSWICPQTGGVLLRKGDSRRGPGESREEWRRRTRDLPHFDCQLVAARLPPPTPLTGWSDRLHLKLDEPESVPGPKPLLWAVPAGAVFFFEGPDAPALSHALAWHGEIRDQVQTVAHRRSTLLGEKGFGLGVCGPWKYREDD